MKPITKSAVPKFRSWLEARGAEIIEPTNKWELLRFRCTDGTAILYTNQRGMLTMVGPVLSAWHAYKTGAAWRAVPSTKRAKKSNVEVTTIRARDGNLCFFCAAHVYEEDESVEHLVPLTVGGPQHISNKFLAHRLCNAEAGHLSAPEKISVHLKARTLQHVAVNS